MLYFNLYLNKLLDSMFTERLMDKYNENIQSYRNASLIENSDGLRNKKYMVIHGLADINVHFQHSVMLSKELQHDGITFEQQVGVLSFYNKLENKF